MPRSAHTRYHQTGRVIHPNQLTASSAEMHRRWASAPIHRVTCIVCSEPFETRSLQAPRQFCSDRCQDGWRANKFVGETRNCDHCGQNYFAVRRPALLQQDLQFPGCPDSLEPTPRATNDHMLRL
jgi:hypothetical protein